MLLQTATGFIANVKEKQEEEIRIVFDSCSQQTHITVEIAKKLKLTPVRTLRLNIKPGGKDNDEIVKANEYYVCIKTSGKNCSIYVNAIAVPVTCSPFSNQNIKAIVQEHPFLKELKLADKSTDGSSKNIKMLIGADIYWKLVNNDIKKDDNSGMIAINSSFGWLVNGPVSPYREKTVNLVSSHVLKIRCDISEEQSLSNSLHKFYDLDSVGIAENKKSVYDEFNEKSRLQDGRYTVKLPFKENHAALPENFMLSRNRPLQLKSRLDKDAELRKTYDEIMKEQLEAGVIEEVNDNGTLGTVTYLPHREVIRNDKATTKVRVVFEASAKKGNNISLNDILYKGPSLTPELCNMLLKFRIYPIAITADIEKAFLQIKVDTNHRDFLRFLYYRNIDNPNAEIVRYRFTRVIFGATSSQSLLNGTVQKHARRYEKTDSEFSRKVREHFYVDDLNTGVKTSKEGIELYDKFKTRFGECKFNVVKWRTNDEKLREEINIKETGLNNKKMYGGKILGLPWNEKNDTLNLNVQELFQNVRNMPPTKRNVLKAIARVYDPVGYIQPVAIRLKLMFQIICSTKIGWDDYIDDGLNVKWANVISDLENFSEVIIRRCYFRFDVKDTIKYLYLHGFSDSSEEAYAACVYVKAVSRCNNVKISLVAAKSRLMPIKKEFTIPRKLIAVVYEVLSQEIEIGTEQFCWTGEKISSLSPLLKTGYA